MKTILVLAALVAVLYAKSFTMETRSSGSFRARLIAANLYQKYLEEQHLRRAQILASGSQPFIDYADDFYLGNVTVGSPPQTTTLVLDTGSSNLWFIDAACTTAACNGQPSSGYTKHKFDTTKSSTFTKEARTFSIQYGSGSCSGYLGTDTISFAGLTIKKQEFGVATHLADVFGYQPIDGTLGLGWPDLAEDNVGAALFWLRRARMNEVFPNKFSLGHTSNAEPAFHLGSTSFHCVDGRKLTISSGGNAGLITYGAFDTKNCQSQINYVPLSAETWWQFPIQGFTIGGFAQNKNDQVISDTGTSWIGAPTNIVSGVVMQTGAKYDFTSELYTVPCSTQKTQPDLIFTINGVKYNVPSVEYVIDLGLGNGQCALTFFAMNSGGFNPAWILGDTWIRTYCNIYDIGQKRIGFAKANHSGI